MHMSALAASCRFGSSQTALIRCATAQCAWLHLATSSLRSQAAGTAQLAAPHPHACLFAQGVESGSHAWCLRSQEQEATLARCSKTLPTSFRQEVCMRVPTCRQEPAGAGLRALAAPRQVQVKRGGACTCGRAGKNLQAHCCERWQRRAKYK
jgi:hypothetical protein